MAEVNANSLPAKTDLGTNDSAIVVDQTTNAGALVDLDVLADKVLDRITSKTFANQVGGSSAATLLAQLSTLNSNLSPYTVQGTAGNNWYDEFKKAITGGAVIANNSITKGVLYVGSRYWFTGLLDSTRQYGSFILGHHYGFFEYRIVGGKHYYKEVNSSTWTEITDTQA